MGKKAKLILKGISEESGQPFKREIRTLDEVRESGQYTLVGYNVSEDEGLPPADYDDCNYCFIEALLSVTRNSSSSGFVQKETIGQTITISNREDGGTNIYNRSWSMGKNNEEWTPWLMIATGNMQLIAQNNDVVKAYTEVSENLDATLERIEKAEDSISKNNEKVLEYATVRFDRVEENITIINAGEADSVKEVVYYKPSNIFVAADSSGAYWDTWSGRDAYMRDNAIYENKLYICGNQSYIWDGTMLCDVSEKVITLLQAEISRANKAEQLILQLMNNIKPVEYSGTVFNSPDEEDITQVDNALKLKDRAWGDGMGYVILRKNKPLQEQLTEENTIYEVRYDFDLGGEEIIIPANCVLKFDGGSLRNGTVSGNNTQSCVNPLFVNVTTVDIINKIYDLFEINLHRRIGYSAILQEIANSASSGEYITILLKEGKYIFDKSIDITPSENKSLYFSIKGKGFASKIIYNGAGSLLNVYPSGGIGLELSNVLCAGNGNNTILKSHIIEGSAPYFHYLNISDCFIRNCTIGIDIARGYSIVIDNCQFRANNTALKLNCANHTAITKCNFPYGNSTCIEFDNTELSQPFENSSVSTMINGCRFEAMDAGIVLKSVWCSTISDCYFEPTSTGKSIIMDGSKRISDVCLTGNYCRYDRFMDIIGECSYISFVKNNMSIEFKEGCTPDSIFISNYDYENFTIKGVIDDVAIKIYDDSIKFNKFAPQNIIRPNLISVPETIYGEITFNDEEWEYTIEDSLQYGSYFYLYGIDIRSGNQYQRAIQIIDADSNEVIYEYSGIDAAHAAILNPILTLRASNTKRLKIVLKRLTSGLAGRKYKYSITFAKALYNY